MAQHLSTSDVLTDVGLIERANGAPLDCVKRKVAAAISILDRMLGREWLERHILGDHAKRDTFIQPRGADPFDQFKLGDRIVMLAEHLVNLQDIDGFDFCLQELRTDTIEPSYAKLIAAGMLQKRGIPLRFVVTSNRLGQDYDATAIIGATTVLVEMKAKVEGNAVSGKSIGHSLKRARKQFPKGTPTLVFLRVPEPWGRTEPGRLEMLNAIVKEFRDSGSIGVVVVHYERWYDPPEEPGGGERRHRLLVVANGRAHVDLAALEDTFTAVPESLEGIPWTTLDQLLCMELAPNTAVPRQASVRKQSGTLPDVSDLTVIGPVELQYAHVCDKAIRNPTNVTWRRIHQHVHLRPGFDCLPAKSDLAIGLLGRRRFKEGKATLRVLFGKDEPASVGTFHEQEIDFFRVGGSTGPVIARQTLDVGSLKVNGPGIYYFDFLVETQYLGRLPLLLFTNQMPPGRVNRGLFRNKAADLEFGHIVQRAEPPAPDDPVGAFTLHGVVEGLGLPEPSPIRLEPLMLVLGLSADEGSDPSHRVSLQFRDGQGVAISDTIEATVPFVPFLPGVQFAVQTYDLANLVCPGPGLYQFHVSVDGRLVGRVNFPVFLGSET